MKYALLVLCTFHLAACATHTVAKNLNFVSFDESAKGDQLKTAGSVDGQDCTWSVVGYNIGPEPSVRRAFANTASQTQDSMIPGQQGTQKSGAIKVVKNISVETGGFDIWLLGRRCITVTGAGFR